jgi:MEDS: MEthanogen/methylotroph, DcmR Sensory domain
MVNIPYITRCGLPGIEHVPFGMHACHFYRNRNELVAAMVPYFIAGLRENERCLWITAPALPAHEASQALRAASDGVDEAIQAGALRNPRLRPVAREFGAVEGTRRDPVLTRGGRACARRRLQRPSHHREYELPYAGRLADVHGVRTGLERALPLPAHRYDCSYARARCNDQQTSEVMHAHHCAFERPDTDWQVIAASEFSSREA